MLADVYTIFEVFQSLTKAQSDLQCRLAGAVHSSLIGQNYF